MLGFLSALGIVGNLANDAYHHNRDTNMINVYINKYGEKRGRDEYFLLRGKSSEQRVTLIAAYGLDIPYNDSELAIIKRRVTSREAPFYEKSVLNRYNEQTGEFLHY